eukprot:7272729-Lingulodinium_polyedra.AAC.1
MDRWMDVLGCTEWSISPPHRPAGPWGRSGFARWVRASDSSLPPAPAAPGLGTSSRVWAAAARS